MELTLQIKIREQAVLPPFFTPADPERPTAEEIAENDRLQEEWVKAGGLDVHYHRAYLVIGPDEAFATHDLSRIKHKAMHSPNFHKDDAALRNSYCKTLWNHIGLALAQYGETIEPTPPVDS